MKLKTKEFKEACQTILYAIDTKEASLFTETLELRTEGSVLNMNVTNREYYVTTKFELDQPEEFVAAVNAMLFLNLISKITTEFIDITIDGNTLKVVANGEYKLPMIYNNNTLMELPRIDIENVTNKMVIPSEILQSILIYNSKELARGVPTSPVQSYYYIDEFGAITFTSGACVNSFVLPSPVKMLLSNKVVKLFRLFKNESSVNFTMGQEAVTDEIIQSKVRFESGNVILTAKLIDNTAEFIQKVPVSTIRKVATSDYAYSSVLDKNWLIEILNRILLFNKENEYGKILFNGADVTISDYSGENKETMTSSNDPDLNNDEYSMIINLKKLKLTLEGSSDQYITMCFGDHKSVVIKKPNISDILPELRVR